jgi:hypothetical protein
MCSWTYLLTAEFVIQLKPCSRSSRQRMPLCCGAQPPLSGGEGGSSSSVCLIRSVRRSRCPRFLCAPWIPCGVVEDRELLFHRAVDSRPLSRPEPSALQSFFEFAQEPVNRRDRRDEIVLASTRFALSGCSRPKPSRLIGQRWPGARIVERSAQGSKGRSFWLGPPYVREAKVALRRHERPSAARGPV